MKMEVRANVKVIVVNLGKPSAPEQQEITIKTCVYLQFYFESGLKPAVTYRISSLQISK